LGTGQALHPNSGTKALMLAVLDNAITCYLGRTPRMRAEAEHWFATGEQQSPFSFTVICETLGLEPNAVRDALKRLRADAGAPRRGAGRRRPNVRRAGRLVLTKSH